MDNLTQKRLNGLRDRLTYIRDIFLGKHADSVKLLQEKLDEFTDKANRGLLQNP